MRAPGTGAARALLLAVTGAAVLLAPTATPVYAAPTAGTSVAVPQATSPTGTAILRGVLLFGTTPTPVAGESVVLHGVAGTADPLTLQTKTDAKGRFVFTGLAGGKDWSYTVTTVRSGVTFSSDVLTVDAAATKTFTLTEYDSTTSPATIAWPEWLVWLDLKGSTLAVQQDLTLHNSGAKAYTGSEPVGGAPDKGKAAVTLPVIAGASNLAYLGFFEVCCDALSATSWAHTRPIPPGASTGTMRYEAPAVSTLSFPVTVPVNSFQMLVPSGTEVSSPQLQSAGTQTDGGTTYQVFKGGPFTVGTTVTVSLGGVASGGAPWAWIVAGLLVVALAIGGWWSWRRRRAAVVTPPTKVVQPGKAKAPAPGPAKAAAKPAKAPKPSAPAPTPATAAKAPPAAPAAAAAAPPAADAEVLADELAMLDLAHDNGALPDEESYQRVRESLVARLMAALGDDPDALARRKP